MTKPSAATVLHQALRRASDALMAEDWHGREIARTGEEDPLAVIDDPDLAPVIAAKLQLRRSQEAQMFRDLNHGDRQCATTLMALEARGLSALTDANGSDHQVFIELAREIGCLTKKVRNDRVDRRIARLFLLVKFQNLPVTCLKC
jgi:glycyl-tRNA synthetase beta chain